MLLVGERRVPDAALPQPPSLSSIEQTTRTTTFRPAAPDIERAAWKAGVMGALNLATQILAVRLTLLVAVAGGIALTWLAIGAAEPYPRLVALAIYGGTVVMPLVWLTGSGRA